MNGIILNDVEFATFKYPTLKSLKVIPADIVFKEKSLTVMPADILFYIFSFLPLKDLCIQSRTCRQWKQLIDGGYFWKTLWGDDLRKIREEGDFNEQFLKKSDTEAESKENYKEFFLRKRVSEKNIENLATRNQYPGKGFPITSIAANNGWLASVDSNGNFLIHELKKINKLHERAMQVGTKFGSIACGSNGRIAVAAKSILDEQPFSSNRQLCFLNIAEGSAKWLSEDSPGQVVISRGEEFISGGNNGVVKMWDINTTTSMFNFKLYEPITGIAADNNTLIVLSTPSPTKSTLSFWDLKSPQKFVSVTIPRMLSLAWEEPIIALAGKTITIVDVRNATSDHIEHISFNTNDEKITNLGLSGDTCVSTCGNEVKIWSLITGSPLRSFTEEFSIPRNSGLAIDIGESTDRSISFITASGTTMSYRSNHKSKQ